MTDQGRDPCLDSISEQSEFGFERAFHGEMLADAAPETT